MYVPHCKYDIFISYAHVDDLPFPGSSAGHARGWVTTFVGCLKTRLAQKLGRSDAYSLWMDHEMESWPYISQQLLSNIRDSASLVVVLSPGYVASPWCQRERNAFLALLEEHVARPVFLVERERVEDEFPAELMDRKIFRFWVQEREGKAPRILGVPCPDPADHEYYNQIDDLCQDIATNLKRLRGAGGAVTALAASSPSSLAPAMAPRGRVYLAQVTDDLDFQRNSVKRYLEQAGVEVLPATWYSQDPKIFRAHAEQDLERCDLFVQLISETAGKRPEDLPQGYPQFQLELALATDKPILQWRNPTLDCAAIEDKAHQAFLTATTVRSEGLEDFKGEILRQLVTPPVTHGLKKSVYVFVDMESADRPFAEQICDILDRYGAEYVLPVQSDNPTENRHDLEQNLVECDALIVIYGSATKTWVRGQLQEARKSVALRKTPLRALAVFEGPPEEKAPLDMKIQGMQVLDHRKGINEHQVRQFLDSLVVAEAGS